MIAALKTIMAWKIENLSLSERGLQKLRHYSLDANSGPTMFLIFFFITEKYNYFHANYII